MLYLLQHKSSGEKFVADVRDDVLVCVSESLTDSEVASIQAGEIALSDIHCEYPERDHVRFYWDLEAPNA